MAKRANAGPPGYPKPRIFAVLSKASPTASSNDWPNILYLPIPITSTRRVCPPETRSATNGNFGSDESKSGANQMTLHVMNT